jgi:hypothetical protein
MPGSLIDNADRQPVFLIGSYIAVLNEDVLALQIRKEPGMKAIELLPFKRPVHLSPPDLVLAGGFFDEELVVGASSCVMPGTGNKRAQVRQEAFTAPDRLFVKNRCGHGPVNIADVTYTVVLKTVITFRSTHFGNLL